MSALSCFKSLSEYFPSDIRLEREGNFHPVEDKGVLCGSLGAGWGGVRERGEGSESRRREGRE